MCSSQSHCLTALLRRCSFKSHSTRWPAVIALFKVIHRFNLWITFTQVLHILYLNMSYSRPAQVFLISCHIYCYSVGSLYCTERSNQITATIMSLQRFFSYLHAGRIERQIIISFCVLTVKSADFSLCCSKVSLCCFQALLCVLCLYVKPNVINPL